MLTQQQVIDIWAEKVRLTQELSFVPDEDKVRRTQIRNQIEYCDKQLVQDRLEPTENAKASTDEARSL